jgi:hypothetical protein
MSVLLVSANRVRLRNGKLALSSSGSVAVPEDPPVDPTVMVTLTEPIEQRVYQRVGTAKTIDFAGTYTGTVSAIEARIVTADLSLTPVTAWETLDATPSDGTFAGTLSVPQGGWYKVQWRASGEGTASTTVNKFGVGLVLAVLGQSNAAGMQSSSSGGNYPSGDPRVVRYIGGAYLRSGTIADSFPPNTSYSVHKSSSFVAPDQRGDGQSHLVNLISAGLNLPVCVINRAVSASYIASWMAGQVNWTAFANDLAAAGGDCEATFWLQGENDAGGMSTSVMKLRLADLHGQLKAVTGRNDSQFHFGPVSLGVGAYNGSTEGEFGNMRAAHVEYGNTALGAFFGTSAHDQRTGDGVHMQALSYAHIGKRWAKSLLARFGIGNSGAGPRITGATRSGLNVTLVITHAGGTALTDGAGGTSGAALTGFEFKDVGASGAIIAYTTAISGNAIICTLASAPTGALTVSYAMMNNPHSVDSTTAPVLASIPCDNALYLNSTVGCPLQPCAAITVTGS